MNWMTFVQVALLMLWAYLLSTACASHVIDKRRSDTIKRKEAGVWLGE